MASGAAAELYVGVDVGTGGCKTSVLDGGGRLVSSAFAEYPTRRTVSGEVTQDPRDWLRAVVETVSGSLAGLDARHVQALAVTAPAHNVALTDACGEALTRVVTAFDARPAGRAEALRERYGPGFFDRTFVELSPAWTLAQLDWLRDALPGVWRSVRWVLPQKDFVRMQLCGEAATDKTDAAGTAMYDQRAGVWLGDLADDLRLPREALPPIGPSAGVGGRLGRAWAERLGLVAGTPVAIGATDTAAELESLGAVEPDSGLVKIASTATVVAVSAEPRPTPGLLTYPHCRPGRWYTVAATSSAAASLRWLRENVLGAGGERLDYARIDALAVQAGPGAGGVLFLPFLQGERCPWWDRDLRAAFLGLAGAHDARHVARAVLDGVALSLRTCRDTLEATGLTATEPFLTGGGFQSRLWRSIVAAALGRPAQLATPHGPALGAALLAARSQGREVVPARELSVVRPDPAWTSAYEDLLPVYVEAVEATTRISHRLARRAGHG